jgi:hypothetical protein
MLCSICFDDITEETGHAQLSCTHRFHLRCITHWYATQLSKEIDESCPYCRRAAGSYDRLPDMIVSDSEEEVAHVPDDIYMRAAQERARQRFSRLRAQMPTEAFEAYAATRIASLFRGHAIRKLIRQPLLKYINLKRDIKSSNAIIQDMSRSFEEAAFRLIYHVNNLCANNTSWRSSMAVTIQATWRGYSTRKRIANTRSPIIWRRVEEGWIRHAYVPGESSLWNHVGLPPQSLEFQLNFCAKKIQSIWRTHRLMKTAVPSNIIWRQVGPRAWQRLVLPQN